MLGGAGEVQTPKVKDNVVPIRRNAKARSRAAAPAVQPRKPRAGKRKTVARNAGGGPFDRDDLYTSLFREFMEKALRHGRKCARALGIAEGTTEEMLRAVHVELAWWNEVEGCDMDDIHEERLPDTPESARVYCLYALEVLLEPLQLHEGDAYGWVRDVDDYFDKLRRFAPKAAPAPSQDVIARWSIRWEKTHVLKDEIEELSINIKSAQGKLAAITRHQK